MAWTDQEVDTLKDLWGQGLSASQIGKILGKTRNAVIGKAHRLKLASRPSPIKKVANKATADKKSSTAAKPKETRKKTTAKKSDAAKTAKKATQSDIAKVAESLESKEERAKIILARLEKTRRMAEEAAAEHKAVDSKPQLLPPGGGITIMELTRNTCRWPIGDPRHPGFRYCGQKTVGGSAYCGHHLEMAFQQPGRDDEKSTKRKGGFMLPRRKKAANG